MMDGSFDDALTGEQKIRNFNLNFGHWKTKIKPSVY